MRRQRFMFVLRYARVVTGLTWLTGVLFLWHQGLGQTAWGTVYALCAYLSQNYALVTLALCTTTLLPMLLAARRSVITVLCTLAAWGVHSFLILDSLVVEQFRYHINAMVLDLFFQPAHEQIVHLVPHEWLVLCMGLLGLAMIHAVMAYRMHHARPIAARKILGTHAGLLLLWVVTQLGHALAEHRGLTTITRYSNLMPAQYALTAKRFLNRYSRPEASLPKQPSHHHTLNYPQHPLRYSQTFQRFNILVIGIDAWRHDALRPDIMPQLSLWQHRMIRYDHHWSGGNCTPSGLFSLFYGLPSTYWSAFRNQRVGPVLFEALKHRGYAVHVATSAPLDHPPFHHTLFVTVPDLKLSRTGSITERDRDITEETLAFIKQHHKQPFFAFVFYDAAHGYERPPQADRIFQPSHFIDHFQRHADTDPTPLKHLYWNNLHHVDHHIATLLNHLSSTQLLDHTLVIITSDHGEAFNEHRHNFWGHGSRFGPEQMRVPLWIYWPGKQPQRHTETTTHHDLIPTIMRHVLGVQNASQDYSIGSDLFHHHPMSFMLTSSYARSALLYDQHAMDLDTHQVSQVGRQPDLRPFHIPPSILQQALKQMSVYQRP